MQAVLVMFRSDGERRSFSVTRDMTVVGRREDCDLRIPLTEVSRKHCRLVRDGDSLRLEDLGSSNGTYLNGQRVQEAVLTPGDSVQIGPVVFVLQVDGYPADSDLNPVAANLESEPVDASHQSATTENAVADLVEGLDPVPEPEHHEEGIFGAAEHAGVDESTPLELEPAPEDDHHTIGLEPSAGDDQLLALEPAPEGESAPAIGVEPGVERENDDLGTLAHEDGEGGLDFASPEAGSAHDDGSIPLAESEPAHERHEHAGHDGHGQGHDNGHAAHADLDLDLLADLPEAPARD